MWLTIKILSPARVYLFTRPEWKSWGYLLGKLRMKFTSSVLFWNSEWTAFHGLPLVMLAHIPLISQVPAYTYSTEHS